METKDYKDTANDVDNFKVDDMKNLIAALKESEDRFIFSCRAVLGSNIGKKTTEELREANKNIFKYVFEHFLSMFDQKGEPLWVLAIEKDDKSKNSAKKSKDKEEGRLSDEVKSDTLADLVIKNKITEIMITNYEIHDFIDVTYPNIRFKVYSFTEFLKILINYANV